MENEKHISMEIINPFAAGIDIGSRYHFVALGQGEKDVREFWVYNEDLKVISNWLKEIQIKTVAMDSTELIGNLCMRFYCQMGFK